MPATLKIRIPPSKRPRLLEATNSISSDGSSIDLEYAALTRQHDEAQDHDDDLIGPDETISEKENLQQVPLILTSTTKKCKQVEGASNGKSGGAYIQLMPSIMPY